MNSKIRSLLFACVGLLFGMSVMYVYNNFIADKKENLSEQTNRNSEKQLQSKEINNSENSSEIYSITEEKKVIDYVKQNHKLPDYYITKNESQEARLESFSGKSLRGSSRKSNWRRSFQQP